VAVAVVVVFEVDGAGGEFEEGCGRA